MTIKEGDVRNLVASGPVLEEWFLESAQEMSWKIRERLAKNPQDVLSGLEKVEKRNLELARQDSDVPLIISPLRAAALYIDFLCVEPIMEVASKNSRVSVNLTDFANGMSHISTALLRAEGGIANGSEKQALYELKAESVFFPLEMRGSYIENNKVAREELARRRAEALRQKKNGTVLINQEFEEMKALRQKSVGLGNGKISGSGWSDVALFGAEFAIEMYAIVYPKADKRSASSQDLSILSSEF